MLPGTKMKMLDELLAVSSREELFWLHGYLAALRDHKLKPDDRMIIVNDLEKDNCIQAAYQLMQLRPIPDGLFVTSDIAAVYCMQTFKHAGIQIPEDIAVAGFNNDRVSTIIEPSLTTINYSGFTMGETAARMLINHLRGNIDITTTSTVILNSDLVIRQSSLRKG